MRRTPASLAAAATFAGRGLVGFAEAGLADRVYQVIHHVDRARSLHGRPR